MVFFFVNFKFWSLKVLIENLKSREAQIFKLFVHIKILNEFKFPFEKQKKWTAEFTI